MVGDQPTEPNDFDHLVAELLAGPWTGPWGLADGLVGLGGYARERSPATGDSPASILLQIDGALIADAPGLSEPTAVESLPAHPGMAHGLAGPLSWLVSAGAPERVLVVAHQRLVALTSRMSYAPARLGWCRGDTGTAAALVRAASLLGDAAMDNALEATQAALRLPVPADADDLSICHGAAGVAHTLARIATYTGDPAVEHAARVWTTFLLDQVIRGGVPDQPGLLDGASGIALVLFAAVTSAAPEWDRLLLLS